MTEHEKLREAIRYAQIALKRATANKAPATLWDGWLRPIIAAAESTLPKTKMVEVWHIEYYDLSDAVPRIGVWKDQAAAEAHASKMRASASSCIRVTGPHTQEVPA